MQSSWNASLFETQPATSYKVAIATNEFLTSHSNWTGVDSDTAKLQHEAISWERLEPIDCLNRYLDILNTGLDVVVVTEASIGEGPSTNTTLLNTFDVPGSATALVAMWWICTAYPKFWGSIVPSCDLSNMKPYWYNWTVGGADVNPFHLKWSSPVEYCLSNGTLDAENKCGFYFRYFPAFPALIGY